MNGRSWVKLFGRLVALGESSWLYGRAGVKLFGRMAALGESFEASLARSAALVRAKEARLALRKGAREGAYKWAAAQK